MNLTKKRVFNVTMIYSTTAIALAQLVMMWWFKQRTGTDFSVALYKAMHNAFIMMLPPQLTASEVAEMKQLTEAVSLSYVHQLPALIIKISLVLAYIAYMLMSLFSKIFKKHNDMFISFSELRASQFVAKGFILFMALTFLVKKSDFGQNLYNVETIFAFILMFCGIACLDRKMKEKKYDKVLRFFVVLSIILGLWIPIVAYVFIAVGMFDALKFRDDSNDISDGGNING